MLRDRDSDPSKAGLSEYFPWVDLLSMSSEPLLAAAGKWTVVQLPAAGQCEYRERWRHPALARGPTACEQASSTGMQS